MKNIFLLVTLFVFSLSTLGQSRDSKWAAGISAAFVKFDVKGSNIIGDQYNFQFPKLNIVRYLSSGLSLEGGLSYGAVKKIDGYFNNAFNYFSLDGAIRYDFNATEENTVPYISLGGSIMGAPKGTLPGAKVSPTLNFSGGITFWVSPSYGLNFQGTYKYSPEYILSMQTHFQFSAGIVYSFSPRFQINRLWDLRH